MILTENASNKSCAELNFLQKLTKSIWSTPGVELEGFKDLPLLRYYNAQEWESRLTLLLKSAKNINFIEKWMKQKLRRINFPIKIHGENISVYPRSEGRGSKDLVFWFYLKFYLKTSSTSLHYCVIVIISFSTTILINFCCPGKIQSMIFEFMYIFRLQLIIWWDVKIFLPFQCTKISQKWQIFEAL